MYLLLPICYHEKAAVGKCDGDNSTFYPLDKSTGELVNRPLLSHTSLLNQSVLRAKLGANRHVKFNIMRLKSDVASFIHFKSICS